VGEHVRRVGRLRPRLQRGTRSEQPSRPGERNHHAMLTATGPLLSIDLGDRTTRTEGVDDVLSAFVGSIPFRGPNRFGATRTASPDVGTERVPTLGVREVPPPERRSKSSITRSRARFARGSGGRPRRRSARTRRVRSRNPRVRRADSVSVLLEKRASRRVHRSGNADGTCAKYHANTVVRRGTCDYTRSAVTLR
jgi:hypothetical protein